MVTSLPAMDLKRLNLTDQMLSSPRRKVVSRFSLGIVLSFIIFSVVLFNTSSKGPIFSPVFQGLYSFGNSSSSFRSWPFKSFVNANNASECRNGTSGVENLEHFEALNGTLEGNVERSSQSLDFDRKDGIFERNVSRKSKDGSFLEEGGSVGISMDVKNVSQIDSVKGNGDRIGISVENVKNGSVGVKEDGHEGGFPSGNFSISSVEFGKNLSRQDIGGIGDGGLRNEGKKGWGGSYGSYKDCDIFNGKWVRDETKPHYPPGSCPYIDRDFDCHLNGRPDSEYVKWRWQPHDCDIPRFNATDFLERIRGQKLVFVGDSLNRNMWESLVCLLRHGVQDKKRVYEISGRHEFKKKGFYAFRFEDYNCSVDFVSSPFLVKESSFNGKNGSFETLRLDLMDGTTSMYHDADVLIFNTGHWWTHEKTSRGEDYYQEGNYIHPRLKVLEAYKRALSTWGKWVDDNVDRSKTQIIFRGYSVTHFRGGPWNSGGQCHKETEPIFNETHLAKYPTKMKALAYVLKDMKTPVTYLNISRLTDYRKDAHPSIYRPDYQAAQQEVHAQDCSHWCLPGVPDTWNELLYVSLLKSGHGSWRD